jgi:hypothetical protein
MEASDFSEIWNLSTKINGAACKKTTILIPAAVRIADLT